MRFRAISSIAAIVAVGFAAAAVDAKTLRWSSQGDYLTADPMAQNELLTNSINGQVYESPGRARQEARDPARARHELEADEPHGLGLQPAQGREVPRRHATSPPTTWCSRSSACRARPRTSASTATPSARRRRSTRTRSSSPRRCPNPVMLEMLANSLFMMSKSWCEKNNAVNTQDFTNEKEAYTARNANGTGPFILVLARSRT